MVTGVAQLASEPVITIRISWNDQLRTYLQRMFLIQDYDQRVNLDKRY